MLTFIVDKLYVRSSTPFLFYNAKYNVLTYFIQHAGQFEIKFSDIFGYLQYDLYMFQVSVIFNFGDTLTVSISLVMEYFNFTKSLSSLKCIGCIQGYPTHLISRHIFL